MRLQTEPGRAQPHEPICIVIPAGAVLLTLGVLSLASATVMAQTPGQEAPLPSPANTAAAAPAKGAVDDLGKWVEQGVTNMGAGFGAIVGAVGGQANQAARDAAEAARNAATSVTRLPSSGITGGHERCAIAPNGAPDCRIAAESMCRAKGYGSGTSVDFVTVENCPPQYRTSRRDAPERVCTMEHFVTKALCQ